MTPDVTAYQEPPEAETGAFYERSEGGNAHRLVDTHGADLRHCRTLGVWHTWDGRRWAEDIDGEAERRALAISEQILDEARRAADDKLWRHGLKSNTSAGVRGMLALTSAIRPVPLTVDQLDADPWTFNTANGTVDLTTGLLRPHQRADLITKIAPVDYQPDATAPRWTRFLAEIFDSDNELIGFVQRYAGYSLTGTTTEQVFAFCHGVGANGKTTMLNTLRAVTGDYSIHLDPAVLTLGAHEQHPTGLTDLRGARLVATVETEQGRRLNEVLVKQLTGGDAIRARRMHRDYFEFTPTHKLWMAGNHLPRIDGTDQAIWRRVALIPFTQQFTGCRADLHLEDRLADEAPGILAWAIQGCLDWQQHGLRIPDRVRAATADYRASQDHVGRFLADTCTTSDTAHVTAKALRDAYETWCHEQGEPPWTAQALGRELTSRGHDSMRTKSSRQWLGIGLLEAQE